MSPHTLCHPLACGVHGLLRCGWDALAVGARVGWTQSATPVPPAPRHAALRASPLSAPVTVLMAELPPVLQALAGSRASAQHQPLLLHLGGCSLTESASQARAGPLEY